MPFYTRLECAPVHGGGGGQAVFIGEGDGVFPAGRDGGDESEMFRYGCDGLDVAEGDGLVFREKAGGGDGEVV